MAASPTNRVAGFSVPAGLEGRENQETIDRSLIECHDQTESLGRQRPSVIKPGCIPRRVGLAHEVVDVGKVEGFDEARAVRSLAEGRGRQYLRKPPARMKPRHLVARR